jgi:hypothetical protein
MSNRTRRADTANKNKRCEERERRRRGLLGLPTAQATARLHERIRATVERLNDDELYGGQRDAVGQLGLQQRVEDKAEHERALDNLFPRRRRRRKRKTT